MEIKEAIRRIEIHNRIHSAKEPRAIKITEALDMAIDALKNKDNYVEVVRCKDCYIPHNNWTGCPMLDGLVTPPDFYCAFGVHNTKE